MAVIRENGERMLNLLLLDLCPVELELLLNLVRFPLVPPTLWPCPGVAEVGLGVEPATFHFKNWR